MQQCKKVHSGQGERNHEVTVNRQAAMLDEMDEVFGVAALVAEEQAQARRAAYAAPQLRGLRVAHDLDAVPAHTHPSPHTHTHTHTYKNTNYTL